MKKRIEVAKSYMRYNTIYNRINWDLKATNLYTFDQTKGSVQYQTDDPKVYGIVTPNVLGTFNVDENTFLWADKDKSIKKHLSDKLVEFRHTLPTEYQTDKFDSTAEFINDLLALFSYDLNANGFDSELQNKSLIFYAFMGIDIYQNNKLKYTIAPEPHFDLIENEDIVKRIQQMHREMFDINDKYYNKGELKDKEAFKAMNKVHLSYCLNKDKYLIPPLVWPCDYDENSTSDWQIIKLRDADRLFVVYSLDTGWTIMHYAYEIDKNANGNKIILGKC